jgi:hypothetical protein
MKTFEIADLQEMRFRQDDKQGCCALNFPFDFEAELPQRMSESFLYVNSFGRNRSQRQHAGQDQGRCQDDRNEQAQAGSKRKSLQPRYRQVPRERGQLSL